MTEVTFQLIEGLERGRVYAKLETPITIGREDENVIRLNDERVSRFHAKVQSDDGRAILTDLDSTNGTRVNGHPVQMRVLQLGDQVAIGRCLLVYGSREEIAARIGKVNSGDSGSFDASPSDRTIAAPGSFPGIADAFSQPDEQFVQPDSPYGDSQPELFPNGPPAPPMSLRPVHRAEISDFLSYAHEQIRKVLQSAVEEREDDETPDGIAMRVDWVAWQQLLQLEMDIAVYVQKLGEPEE